MAEGRLVDEFVTPKLTRREVKILDLLLDWADQRITPHEPIYPRHVDVQSIRDKVNEAVLRADSQ